MPECREMKNAMYTVARAAVSRSRSQRNVLTAASHRAPAQESRAAPAFERSIPERSH
jgi:hypothetical protein